jgi:tRNA A37 threonylcarbamoyladenosine dehydratase
MTARSNSIAAAGLARSMQVTATFGMVAAARTVERLLQPSR